MRIGISYSVFGSSIARRHQRYALRQCTSHIMTPYAHMYMQRRTSTKAFNMINRAKFQFSIIIAYSKADRYCHITNASFTLRCPLCVCLCFFPLTDLLFTFTHSPSAIGNTPVSTYFYFSLSP